MACKMRLSFCIILCLHLWIANGSACLPRFLTRPDLIAPQLTVHVNTLNLADKDLLFLTSFLTDHDAPLIYDLQGNIVWIGGSQGELDEEYHVQNLHTVSFNGSPHLAFTEARLVANGVQLGAGLILSDQYEVVAEFPSIDKKMDLDPHEFELIDNETRIIQQGRVKHVSDWKFARNGIIIESVVQEVDVVTGELGFDWHSLDHVPPDESCLVLPYPEYFHANSVTKDSDGNFLVLAYHACTIYKINGTDGSIIWRLGGNKSDFVMLDGYRLMHMHHIRVRPLDGVRLPAALRTHVTDKTHLSISVLDNGFTYIADQPLTAGSSAAIVILLDLVAMTGQVVERYPHPHGMFAALFGSVQFQPDGSRFIGWGGQRSISQITQNNTLVYHAELANAAFPTFSYRAYKGPWIGHPTTRPDIYSYSWTCYWATTMYASWNGATQVGWWRFFGSSYAQGPFKVAAIVGKDGFETRGAASFFASYTYVEALQADGSVLGHSDVIATKVPGPDFAAVCDQFRCYEELDWTGADISHNCSLGNIDVPPNVSDQAILA